MYSCCLTMSQNSLKNSFGKVVFQILAKIEMTRNKIDYLSAILKQYNILIFSFFCRIIIFIVHTYNIVQIPSQNSAGKVVFYGWVPRTLPPWAPTGVKVPWSLKVLIWYYEFSLTIVYNIY